MPTSRPSSGSWLRRSSGGAQLLAYCVMGNHWHLVVRTTADGALSPFMKWLTLTHTQRYQMAHRHVGEGPVYQGRFKSFVVQSGEHLLGPAGTPSGMWPWAGFMWFRREIAER